MTGIDLALAVTAFALIFPAELPDKTFIATLVLSTRFRQWPVWLGVSSAFAVQVVIAVTAGGLLALLPTTPVQLVQLAATQYIVAAIHIFDYSGTGTLTFQIQSSSSSGGSYTNRGSAGTALSAAGAQWLSATSITTTNTWWRLNVTASASPSATVLASLAIFTP